MADLKEDIQNSIAEHEKFMKMVLKKKYLHEGEETWRDLVDRLNRVLKLTNDERECILEKRFIPGGSILSGAGRDNISMSNCYAIPIEASDEDEPRDSMDAIFDTQKNIANISKRRGGCGFSLSTLRPKNEIVNNAAKTSSGSVSFLSLFSELGKVVGQGGSRRAAMIALLDIRHPDTLNFIWCKSKPDMVFEKDIFSDSYPDISSINISLSIPDYFMKAVENDEDWTFVFPDIDNNRNMYDAEWDGDFDRWNNLGGKFKIYGSIKARDLLKEIANSCWLSGDPGVHFVDSAINGSISYHIDKKLKPNLCNPCSEQMLTPYENCLLGSINLPEYVKFPFVNKDRNFPTFNFKSFKDDVKKAVRILNKASDINEEKHPLKKQIEMDKYSKRIGLGFTGITDTIAMLGMEYGSQESINFVKKLMSIKAFTEISESVEIAKEIGCCPAMIEDEARQGFLNSPYFDNLSSYVDSDNIDRLTLDIIEYGTRNTAFATVAPGGSLSILANNCTSGIEPLFAFNYSRKNRIDNTTYNFIHKYACDFYLENGDRIKQQGITSVDDLKRFLKYNKNEAKNIHWEDRINFQSACQLFTDSSISSTINLPSTTTPEEIYEIYLYAWQKNLKGITIFREDCKSGVLSDNTQTKITTDIPSSLPYENLYKRELFDEENAVRHQVYYKKAKVYLNCSLDDDGKPIEVFAKLPKESGIGNDGCFNPQLFIDRTSSWDCLCRMISMCLRYGIPLDEVIDQLDSSSYSMIDAAGVIVRILKKYRDMPEYEEDPETGEILNGEKCPECGEYTYVAEGGCWKCLNCFYSKCS